jgi:hypothetical protein
MRHYYEDEFEKIIDWDEEWDGYNEEELYEEEWSDECEIIEYNLEKQQRGRQRQRQRQRNLHSQPTTQIQSSDNTSIQPTTQPTPTEQITLQNTPTLPTQGIAMNVNVNRIPTQWIVIGLVGLVGVILLLWWMNRR